MYYENKNCKTYDEESIINNFTNKFGNSSDKLTQDIRLLYKKNTCVMKNIKNLAVKYEGQEASVEDLENTICKYDCQENLARDLQSTIFPTSLPNNESFSVNAKLIPMCKTSGDFYDVVEIMPDGVYGIMLSDISGHGVSASLVTCLAKMIFTKASERSSDPKNIFKFLNDEFCSIFNNSSYFTSVCTLVDFPNKRIAHCSAGHPYAMRYNSKENTVESFKPAFTVRFNFAPF